MVCLLSATRPRYMCCVKCCEVGTQSVFDTGAVRQLAINRAGFASTFRQILLKTLINGCYRMRRQ